MSGIPIYTSSPINASKASAITPQTAASSTQSTPLAPSSVPATSTATPTTSSYPSARPGAAAPAPTGVAQRYAHMQPTPTTKTTEYGPPPPQPAAFPIASGTSSLPPPPKVGETYHPPAPVSHSQPYPSQMSIPPPTPAYGAQLPTSSTQTSTTASAAYPVPISTADFGAPRRSIEHPPGYQQNSYASEFSSDQRRVQDSANNGSSGLGGFGGSEKSGGIDTEGLWNAAKGWATAAGNKLSETEQEIWRRINKEQ